MFSPLFPAPSAAAPHRARAPLGLLALISIAGMCSQVACSVAQEPPRPQPDIPAVAPGTPLFEVGRSTAQSYKNATPREVNAHRGGARIIDVREPGEFNDRLGHIPGAELVPLGTLEEKSAGWDHEAEVVLVCRSGARSRQAAGALARNGFHRVINMEGGMQAYNAAGLAVERR